MTDDLFKRKFSISKLKDNPRKSVVISDSKYEFNAPKFYDFSKPNQEAKINDDFIDPWFFIDHHGDLLEKKRQSLLKSNNNNNTNNNNNVTSRNNLNSLQVSNNNLSNNLSNNVRTNFGSTTNVSSNNLSECEKTYTIDEMIKIHNEKVKKRKYSQYEKENKLLDNKNPGNGVYQTKKKKVSNKKEYDLQPVNFNSLGNTTTLNNNQHLAKAISKTAKKGEAQIENMNKNINKTTKKENINRVNRFDLNNVQSNNNNFQNNKKPQSTSLNRANTYISKVKKTTINTTSNLRSNTTSTSLLKNRLSVSTSATYCPRVHNANIMKKWENLKGIKWYDLSPRSRNNANREISDLLKRKLL